jgi:photosystem II stability/assembly factor-like uncharacterized protein
MVSTDRRTWETRSTPQVLSFAVDPGNGDHILATGPEGVLDSSDGARSWQKLAAPPLVTVSWDAVAGLIGADKDGVIHHSRDGGASWERVGSLPGSPQALLATAEAFYAAAHDDEGTTTIYRSSDGGATWPLLYRDPA